MEKAPVGLMSNFEDEDALFYALARHDDITDDMIKKVNISIKNKYGETFTYAAVSKAANLEKIIKAGGPIDLENDFKMSPLHGAVARGKIESAELLIKAGANINHQDALGNPIFFEALDDKNLEMLQFLMKHNFNPNIVGFMEKRWPDFEFAENTMSEYVKRYNRANPKPPEPKKD